MYTIIIKLVKQMICKLFECHTVCCLQIVLLIPNILVFDYLKVNIVVHIILTIEICKTVSLLILKPTSSNWLNDWPVYPEN